MFSYNQILQQCSFDTPALTQQIIGFHLFPLNGSLSLPSSLESNSTRDDLDHLGVTFSCLRAVVCMYYGRCMRPECRFLLLCLHSAAGWWYVLSSLPTNVCTVTVGARSQAFYLLSHVKSNAKVIPGQIAAIYSSRRGGDLSGECSTRQGPRVQPPQLV